MNTNKYNKETIVRRDKLLKQNNIKAVAIFIVPKYSSNYLLLNMNKIISSWRNENVVSFLVLVGFTTDYEYYSIGNSSGAVYMHKRANIPITNKIYRSLSCSNFENFILYDGNGKLILGANDGLPRIRQTHNINELLSRGR